MTKHEVTGDRDLWLSQRHRTWGPLYASDIDNISLEHNAEMPMAEYNNRKPVALIDYKTWNTPTRHDASTDVLIDLATHYQTDTHPNGLPMFVVLWHADQHYIGPANRQPIIFRAIPKNSEARHEMDRRRFQQKTDVMSERAYVTWMYQLRHLDPPTDLIPQLSPVLPATHIHTAAS